LKFWNTFDQLQNTLDPLTLTQSKCWIEEELPWTRPKRRGHGGKGPVRPVRQDRRKRKAKG
jgi:hypothetical protein